MHHVPVRPKDRRWADPPSYAVEVSRGYVRLIRTGGTRRSKGPTRFVRFDTGWEAAPAEAPLDDIDDFDDEPAIDWRDEVEPLDPAVELAIDEATRPRGSKGFSRRSQMNLRRLITALPWEMLGPWPALISLTYPGNWQPWVPDGRVWEAHRKALERRWVRRWGEPIVGVWVKEFQTSGRPHLHLYVGLPRSIDPADFEGLRERTLLRHRLERRHGTYAGRNKTPPVGLGGYFGGTFGEWLRTAWSEVVGTSGLPDGDWRKPLEAEAAHHIVRGVDVAVMFFSDEAEATTDRTRVAQYLAGEAAKWRQKRPPNGFNRVGRYFGVWGRQIGFVPQTTTVAVDPLVAAELEVRLRRWVNWKLEVRRRQTAERHGDQPAAAAGNGAGFARLVGDGITAFGLGPEHAERLLRAATAAAARKRAKRAGGDDGEADVDPLTLLRMLDAQGSDWWQQLGD